MTPPLHRSVETATFKTLRLRVATFPTQPLAVAHPKGGRFLVAKEVIPDGLLSFVSRSIRDPEDEARTPGARPS